MLVASAIGQKVGAAKMMMAATVIAAMVATITARFARVQSIAAPIGVWSAMPRRPLSVDTSPTSVCVQCWPVTRKTLMKGPKRFRTSAERKFSASSAVGIDSIVVARTTAPRSAKQGTSLDRCSFPRSTGANERAVHSAARRIRLDHERDKVFFARVAGAGARGTPPSGEAAPRAQASTTSRTFPLGPRASAFCASAASLSLNVAEIGIVRAPRAAASTARRRTTGSSWAMKR